MTSQPIFSSRFTDLGPEQLVSSCKQRQPDNSHEAFCFELFRRAIVEKSEQCWSMIYQQYKNLVYMWALQFENANAPIDSVEEIVLDAFTAFWRAFTPEKLNKAERFTSLLAYLKSCVATAILQARRKAESTFIEVTWDETLNESLARATEVQIGTEFSAFQSVNADRLWTIVDHCCNSEKERIVARLSLVANLKPRLILEHHPGLFTDVAEIYALSRNLKKRLERDEEMQKLWGEFTE